MLARIIRNRDIITDEEIEEYLNGGTDRLNDPYLLKGMEEAVPLLFDAIRANQKIRVIGDYDTDGICASYILQSYLACLGADCDIRLPDRMSEGYGMNPNMVKEAEKDGIRLILTCDNGVSSYEAAEEAKKAGIRLIISDHHEVPEPLIEADALIDAKQPGCPYPYKELCGAGIAYKIACAMNQRLSDALPQADKKAADHLLCDVLLQFAGIATIADVVPLTGENRIIAKEGLIRLRKTENEGLLALIRERNLNPAVLSSYHIGFILAPCLNSAGRLENAQVALQLLYETVPEEALETARHLSELNEQRKNMTRQQTAIAEKKTEEMRSETGELPKILVLFLPDAHESIAGIIAGRIKELFSRPTLVITNGEDGLKGSGRSVDAYPMITELRKQPVYFKKLGGHAKAAGFSLAPGVTPELLSEALNQSCELTEELLEEKKWIDIQLPFRFLSEDFVEELKRLEPFGLSNERPVFAEKNVRVNQVQILGKTNQVLKVQLESEDGFRIEGIRYGDEDFIASEAARISGQQISLTYYPEINEFRGIRTIQIRILDIC